MKKLTALILFFVVLTMTSSLYAESYLSNVGRNATRGFKNFIGAPLEIPIGIQKAHEGPGFAGVRHVEGLFDGIFKMTQRATSGVWDYVVALVPSDQDGLPPKPETLF